VSLIAGVDACRAGWVSASKDMRHGRISLTLHRKISEILHPFSSYEVIAIDIPIGLIDKQARICDLEAKKILGRRHMCIFPAPPRLVVEQGKDRGHASRISMKLQGRKVSCQTWNIVPKIREVDIALKSLGEGLQVIEVHPELSFYEMNNKEIVAQSKKTEEGKNARLELIRNHLNIEEPLKLRPEGARKTDLSDDDIVDAFSALWTALRKYNHQSIPLPDKIFLDSEKIRMSIWR
jgi:predicted RNase H-like nuclease